MNHALQFAVVAVALVAAPSAASAAESPVDVSDRAQLFIDRTLVRDADGISFRMHPGRKHEANPLITADRPWEGWRLEIYGSVLFDEQERLFKMWYLCAPSDYFDGNMTCYATSHDGIHWDKPLVGTLTAQNGKPHNVVADCHLASVVKDLDEPDASRRYKMICWMREPRGYRTMVSPDGLSWTLESADPIAPEADVITGFWDRRRRQYVAFPKRGHVVRGISRRSFYVITSDEFRAWSTPLPAFIPDLRDDAGSLARIEQVRAALDVPDDPKLVRTEFYGIGAYQAESCTVAFPWMLTVNNNARYGNHEGPGELQLAASRNLIEWARPFRTPVVERGAAGQWDSGFFTTAAEAIRVGDEIRLYYGGANYLHGTPCLYRAEGTGRKTKYTGGIGLATWTLDRFVSVDGPAAGGTLTTVPIAFQGTRLELNAATTPEGSITVELLDAAGSPLAAWGRSDPVRGDELRHSVRWQGNSDVGSLAGRPVALRFHLRAAQLFSFAFRR